MDYSGQRFEHYQIIAKLGQGGMATVYKAYDTRLERDVAIKVVRKESIPPEQLERILKRFEREAKALAKFIHPNIVPVHDYGEYEGAPFLVMAYLPGGTLKERIGRPLPVQTALNYVIPIANALSYAHQRGVIHRDVKPSNILTTEDGSLMLSDFGIAQILEEATTQLTATGMGVGTPEHMAPEQWQGQATAASDQYALGVVLYELLTGQKPYSAETPLAVALKVMSEPLPRPSDLAPEIPEEAEKVLYKALARDPLDRYENMDAFTKALRGLLAEAETVEPIRTQPEDQEPKPIHVVQETQASESMTQDALDVTPVEEMDITPNQKRKLPKWALWAGIGIFGLVIIGLAIGVGGKLVNVSKGGEELMTMLGTKTPTATCTTTATKTSTPTKILILTPTQDPNLGEGSLVVSEEDYKENEVLGQEIRINSKAFSPITGDEFWGKYNFQIIFDNGPIWMENNNYSLNITSDKNLCEFDDPEKNECKVVNYDEKDYLVCNRDINIFYTSTFSFSPIEYVYTCNYEIQLLQDNEVIFITDFPYTFTKP